MKRIINYFMDRQERKLRQWCIDKATPTIAMGIDPVWQAQKYYDWISIP